MIKAYFYVFILAIWEVVTMAFWAFLSVWLEWRFINTRHSKGNPLSDIDEYLMFEFIEKWTRGEPITDNHDRYMRTQ